MTTPVVEKEKPVVEEDQIEDKKGDDVVHLESVDRVYTAAEWEKLLHEAEIAEDEEKNMPLWVAMRTYPKAMIWTFLVTMHFVM